MASMASQGPGPAREAMAPGRSTRNEETRRPGGSGGPGGPAYNSVPPPRTEQVAGGPAGGPATKTISLPPLLAKRFVRESLSSGATWGQEAETRSTEQSRRVERLEEQVKVLEDQVEQERRVMSSLLEAMEGILEGRQVEGSLPEHAALLGRLARAVRGGAARDLNNNREVEAPGQAGRKA